jgi:hypothetical protein
MDHEAISQCGFGHYLHVGSGVYYDDGGRDDGPRISCGDGQADPLKECDSGPSFPPDSYCTTACTCMPDAVPTNPRSTVCSKRPSCQSITTLQRRRFSH